MPLDLESNIVEGAKAGGAGLEELILAIWPEAYRIAFSILRDCGLAEDTAQESCAAVARSLAELKDTRFFRTWCYKIITNNAITVARRRARSQVVDTIANQTVHFDRSDAIDLYHALGALPVVQRGAIVLHYYVGLNSREIAAATGLPRSTVRFHLMLGRRALRKALSITNGRATDLSTEAVSDVH